MEELTGRTIFQNKPLTCYQGTVSRIGKQPLMGIYYVVTEHGEFRLGAGILTEHFEVGSTYFFQTIQFTFTFAPITIVDYIKI